MWRRVWISVRGRVMLSEDGTRYRQDHSHAKCKSQLHIIPSLSVSACFRTLPPVAGRAYKPTVLPVVQDPARNLDCEFSSYFLKRGPHTS
jgi:hypothetical protein